MPKQIQVEDQIIEFPDNMPDNEIEAVIKREFYSQQQPQQPQQNQALQQQQRQQRERQQIANEEGRIGSLFTTATNILPGMARAKALSAALTAKAMGGDEAISNFYDEALKNELIKLSVARDKYPIQSLASELVGGAGVLKTIGAGAKILGKVATSNVATKAINKVGDAAKYLGKNGLMPTLASGGLLGASYAAGETPDLTSKQAIKDAATGGALGAVGGAVIKGAGAVGSAVGKTAKTIKNNINPSASKVLAQAYSPNVAKQEASKLSNKIAENRITTLPEQGGDVALDLTRLVSKTKGGDKILQNYYNTKSAGSAKRVNEVLEKNLSGEKYFDNLDTVIARRKELTKPLYKQAEIEGNEALTKQLEFGNLYDNPNIDKYIKKAINDPLSSNPNTTNKFEQLQNAKIAVDKEIGTMKNDYTGELKQGFGKNYYAAKEIREEIDVILKKASSSYAKADKIFSSESALITAQKKGLKFNQYRNAEELKRYVANLNEGEKEAFIIGVKDALYDKMLKSSDTNPAKAIFGNQLQRDKLKVLFKNPQEYTNFGKRLNDEMRVIQTKQKIVGGTNDFNLQEGSEILNKVANNVISYKTFGVANVLLMTKDAIRKKYYGLNENVAKELAQILINPKRSVEELNKIANKSKTTVEKNLIKKFANDYLISKNITNAIATTAGKLSAKQQEE